MVWKTGWARTISADRPDAAAVPCTMLELVTPTAAHPPRRRPAARVFLVTTAKSGPGISTSTVAKARNSPYVAQVIIGMLPGGGYLSFGGWMRADLGGFGHAHTGEREPG